MSNGMEDFDERVDAAARAYHRLIRRGTPRAMALAGVTNDYKLNSREKEPVIRASDRLSRRTPAQPSDPQSAERFPRTRR